MGDFMGHVLPGTLLLAVGLWRVWASVARFAADPPTAFRVRAWNPVPAVPARLLELHVVAGGAFLDMCVELYYASPLRALTGVGVDGVDHAAAHLGDLGAGVLIAVQGLWFYQTALALYGPMLPAGCVRHFEDPPHSDARVECRGGGGAALERAELLADFQLFGIVLLVFVYVLGCFAVAAARYGNNLEMTTAHHEHVAATAMEEYVG